MATKHEQLTLPAESGPDIDNFAWEKQWHQAGPQAFGRIMLLFYLGTLLISIYQHLPIRSPAAFPWQNVLGIVTAIGGLILVDAWQDRRYGLGVPPKPVIIATLVLRLALIETFFLLDTSRPIVAVMLYLVLPYRAALMLGHRIGNWVAFGIWVWVIARLSWVQTGWYLNATMVDRVVIFSIVIFFILTTAKIVRQEMLSRVHTETLLADLKVSHAQLTEYADQVADMATVTERNRLARDIHDSLGHYLTVINVQLEKALAFRDKNPPEAERAVVESKRLAREALDDVRRSVGTLRREELFSLAQSLDALVAPMRSNHVQIDLDITGTEAGFSRQSLLILYRAAQEGLTNIQRHAHARHIVLTVQFEEQVAVLCLQDDGIGFEPQLRDRLIFGPGDGFGLQGAQERLEIIGGTLSLESSPGTGTRFTITVPRDPMTQVKRAAAQAQKEATDEQESPRRYRCPRPRR